MDNYEENVPQEQGSTAEDFGEYFEAEEKKTAEINPEAKFEGEIFFSTDGKHTVHAKADNAEGRKAALDWAFRAYKQVLGNFGTKADMWSGNMNGNGKAKVDAPICKYHNKPMSWKEGVSKTTGKPYAFWSCTEKTADGIWCDYKPPKEVTR